MTPVIFVKHSHLFHRCNQRHVIDSIV